MSDSVQPTEVASSSEASSNTPSSKFYGAMWCGDTRRARNWFDANNLPYEWIDVDKNADAAEVVKQLNNGFRSIPTIVFPDGSQLTEPSTRKLEEHAVQLGLIEAKPVSNEL